jgi:hypothetical protein
MAVVPDVGPEEGDTSVKVGGPSGGALLQPRTQSSKGQRATPAFMKGDLLRTKNRPLA